MVNLRRQNDQESGPVVVFLPGIIAPPELRYAALIRELGTEVQAFTKDLEIYGQPPPGASYSIASEVDGLVSAVNDAGFDRFYLYGHSAGGAIALAFVAEHPDRILGLALDEPASDFSDATKSTWTTAYERINALPLNEQLAAFLQVQVAPGVEVPTPPPGPAPEWMALRPAGVRAFTAALDSCVLPDSSLSFEGPVYYSFGGLTNPIYLDIRDRLSAKFSHFTSEEYEGLHHLNTSHAADPARVAAALRRVWQF